MFHHPYQQVNLPSGTSLYGRAFSFLPPCGLGPWGRVSAHQGLHIRMPSPSVLSWGLPLNKNWVPARVFPSINLKFWQLAAWVCCRWKYVHWQSMVPRVFWMCPVTFIKHLWEYASNFTIPHGAQDLSHLTCRCLSFPLYSPEQKARFYEISNRAESIDSNSAHPTARNAEGVGLISPQEWQHRQLGRQCMRKKSQILAFLFCTLLLRDSLCLSLTQWQMVGF